MQNVTKYSDLCAFVNSIARLIKGKHQLDIWHFEQTDNGTLVDGYPNFYTQKNGHIHLYNDVFPLKMCVYGGVKMACPRMPMKYLKQTYGENAMIPHKRCVNSKWAKNISIKFGPRHSMLILMLSFYILWSIM